jgi:hypothetical protein
VAEIFVGKMPGQNTPATTTMATIEQGMKVFTAVYKRVYRSLTKEFRKLYKLNKTYMNPEEEVAVLDQPIQQSDYEGPEDDIIPGADPTAVSTQEKQAKVQALLQIMQLGTLNPQAITQLYLEAHDITEPEKYMMQPQPQPPDPKIEALKMKAQLDQQKAQVDMQMSSHKMQLEQASKEQEMQMKSRMMQAELESKQLEAVLAGRTAQAKLAQSSQEHQQKMVQQSQATHLSLATQHATAQQKLQHDKQTQQQKLNTSKGNKPNAANKPK